MLSKKVKDFNQQAIKKVVCWLLALHKSSTTLDVVQAQKKVFEPTMAIVEEETFLETGGGRKMGSIQSDDELLTDDELLSDEDGVGHVRVVKPLSL